MLTSTWPLDETHIYSVSPSHKKRHGKVARKRALFNARQHVKRTLSARDGKQKCTFLKVAHWHARRAHLCTVIKFNTYYIFSTIFKFTFQLKLFFPQFPYFKIHFYQRQLRKFIFPLPYITVIY